jgi:hypothetical protein
VNPVAERRIHRQVTQPRIDKVASHHRRAEQRAWLGGGHSGVGTSDRIYRGGVDLVEPQITR